MEEKIDFCEKFVSDCIKSGITKPNDICDLALKKIEEIDIEIEKAKILRLERDKYQSVLRNFNHKSIKTRGRKQNPTIVNFDADSDMEEYETLIVDIITQFTDVNNMTVVDLAGRVGYGAGTDPTPLYTALKWLQAKNILFREGDRSLSRGNNWDNKFNFIKKEG
jgi:hypothetical protein